MSEHEKAVSGDAKPEPVWSERYIKLYVTRFGERVREVRTSAGMTQAQVAESATRMGVSLTRVMVAKIETGTRPTSMPELLALSTAMHVPMTYLLPGAMDKGELTVRRQGLEDLSLLAESSEAHLEGVLASLEELRATFSMEARRAKERLRALSDDQ